MRRVCACSVWSFCAWLSVGPRVELEMLLWRLWGGEGDSVVHTGFPESEMQTLSFLHVWKFKRIAELLCERHCWSAHTQQTAPDQVSVYVWTCHECKDCLYRRGNFVQPPVFSAILVPCLPTWWVQDEAHVLSDNTRMIFYGNIPRLVPPLNNNNFLHLPLPQIPEYPKPAFHLN